MNTQKLLTCLAATAIAATGIGLTGCGKKEATISYETAKVEKQAISSSVTATGTIEPVTKVEVGTQVSGIISNIYVDYNSVVKKGQVIAELDRTNLISELNSASSELASAKSNLDYQQLNYNRLKTLHEKGLVSDNEYDTAKLSYEQARSTYAARQESVKKAQTNLGYATITSPIDGVILSKSVEEGQTVAASFSTPTLFTIAQDLTDMRVIANVDEADIGGVKEGQRVSFTVDAFPDETFEGRVTQVRQEGTEESNVITYEVVISAPNQELKLKPGLTANVTIFTLEAEGVLSVPTKALRFVPTSGNINPNDQIADCDSQHKVWVKEGNTLKAYAVKTGITNGTLTEITSGISAGKQVITGTTTDAVATTETSTTERSPFAPGPPNKKK